MGWHRPGGPPSPGSLDGPGKGVPWKVGSAGVMVFEHPQLCWYAPPGIGIIRRSEKRNCVALRASEAGGGRPRYGNCDGVFALISLFRNQV